MDHFARSLHIFLSDSQHKRLRQIARVQNEHMTKVARSAIVSYMDSFEEELQTAARDKVRGTDRRPSGLGVDFDSRITQTPTRAALSSPLATPLSAIAAAVSPPNLKPIIEHIRGAENQEEKDRRLSTITETVRAFCAEKEAEEVIRKLKAETEGSESGFAKLLSNLGLGKRP